MATTYTSPPSPPQFLCGPPTHRVVSGTSLVAVVATALTSAYVYSAEGRVDAAAALLISPAAMLTAPMGARLASRLDCAALRRTLAFFLLAAAPLVPLKASCCPRSPALGWGGGRLGGVLPHNGAAPCILALVR